MSISSIFWRNVSGYSCLHSILDITKRRSVNRRIRLGSYFCHSNSTFGRLGTNQYKRRDNTEGCRELGILTSRLQLRSDWWSTLSQQRSHSLLERQSYFQTDCWIYRNKQRSYFQKISVLRLQFLTSLLVSLVLPHTRLVNIFGANWFSQAPQHTVFGEEGELQSVVLVMSLSHHSYQKDLVHSSLLVVRRIQHQGILTRRLPYLLVLQTSTICTTYHWCWYWNIQSRKRTLTSHTHELSTPP